MAFLSTDATHQSALVVEHEACGEDAFVLVVQLREELSPLRPGRFAMLAPDSSTGPVIPRPISIFDQPEPDRLSFLIQRIGDGTRALSDLRPGKNVLVTAPLGNGFPSFADDRELVAVAGGVGSAPFLSCLHQRRDAPTVMVYGARSKTRLYELERFESAPGQLICATDDGSYGFHGHSVAALDAEWEAGRIQPNAQFIACGPAPLLHGFAAWAKEKGVEAHLSLETYMGCGIGVCNACPVPSHPEGQYRDWPWVKTCLDGPVFSLSDIQL